MSLGDWKVNLYFFVGVGIECGECVLVGVLCEVGFCLRIKFFCMVFVKVLFFVL